MMADIFQKITHKNQKTSFVSGKTKDSKKKPDIWDLAALALVLLTLAGLVLYCTFFLDNLMHSDTTAEVILSKLLADENKLITKNWFYSTEIRIVYSQLIMMPLFKIFTDYKLVKLLSIFIFYLLLLWAFWMITKRFCAKPGVIFLGLALLLAPLSNEYLDMMYIGCFYTSQTICTYLVLSYVIKKKPATKNWLLQDVALSVFAFILGLSGLRYLASLYLPMFLATCFILLMEKTAEKKQSLWGIAFTADQLLFAGIGFLVNKFYLAREYSFDTTSEVTFVPLSEVSERFLNSLKLMLEFMGYREIRVVSPLGMVNVMKCLFFLVFVGMILYLWKRRMQILNRKERFLLYYFVFLFLINWYMLIFTNVLMQYRYWLPVYVIGILLIIIFLQKVSFETAYQRPVLAAFLSVVVLSSLYGELWQDTKYNDCEKRYAYMEFLEQNDYDFGYATFWNASVSEYLSNGTIRFGCIGGDDWGAKPYEWLSPKAYYKKGFHQGKTFLLLARTEEAGMLKGDFTIMEDAKLVYQDEYYAIYEGNQGMYLFSQE